MQFIKDKLEWAKNNKLTTLLLLIVIYFIGKQMLPAYPLARMRNTASYKTYPSVGVAEFAEESYMDGRGGVAFDMAMPIEPGFAPPPPSVAQERMVVRNSTISMVVKSVPSTVKTITNYVDSVGGFMVNSNLSNPEDAASANLTLRVPADTLDQTLEYFRSQSIKVVSENLSGTDVTDQYEDIDGKLRILRSNRARLETIMNNASEVSDILRIQKDIFSLQSQIDNLIGRQQYLLKTSQLSSITLYLSTDEFSLPYTPDEPWRPNVVFKRAVRSLVGTLQSAGSAAIWIVVYSVIIIPILVILKLVIRKLKNTKKNPAPQEGQEG